VPANTAIPQFGYFLPIALTPKLRHKRLNWVIFHGENNLRFSGKFEWFSWRKLALPCSRCFRRRKSNNLLFTFHTKGHTRIKPFTNTTQSAAKSSATKYK
jgi:hypothetical protein